MPLIAAAPLWPPVGDQSGGRGSPCCSGHRTPGCHGNAVSAAVAAYSGGYRRRTYCGHLLAMLGGTGFLPPPLPIGRGSSSARRAAQRIAPCPHPLRYARLLRGRSSLAAQGGLCCQHCGVPPCAPLRFFATAPKAPPRKAVGPFGLGGLARSRRWRPGPPRSLPSAPVSSSLRAPLRGNGRPCFAPPCPLAACRAGVPGRPSVGPSPSTAPGGASPRAAGLRLRSTPQGGYGGPLAVGAPVLVAFRPPGACACGRRACTQAVRLPLPLCCSVASPLPPPRPCGPRWGPAGSTRLRLWGLPPPALFAPPLVVGVLPVVLPPLYHCPQSVKAKCTGQGPALTLCSLFCTAGLTNPNIRATLFRRGSFRSFGGCFFRGIHGRQKTAQS